MSHLALIASQSRTPSSTPGYTSCVSESFFHAPIKSDEC